MKSLTAISGTQSEYSPATPQQQVTIGNYPSANRSFARAIRITQDAVMIKRPNAGVCIAMSDLISALVAVEPLLTYAPVVVTQPSNITIPSGNSAEFTVSATVEFPSIYPITYQWQVSTDGSTWNNLANSSVYAGVTTSVLAISSVSGLGGFLYRCVFSTASGTTKGLYAVLTVSPGITVQPVGQTVTHPAAAAFSLTASGQGTVTYRWQNSTDNGVTWTNLTDGGSLAGSQTNDLQFSSTVVGQNGNKLRCVVTSQYGAVTSNAVTLTVN